MTVSEWRENLIKELTDKFITPENSNMYAVESSIREYLTMPNNYNCDGQLYHERYGYIKIRDDEKVLNDISFADVAAIKEKQSN